MTNRRVSTQVTNSVQKFPSDYAQFGRRLLQGSRALDPEPCIILWGVQTCHSRAAWSFRLWDLETHQDNSLFVHLPVSEQISVGHTALVTGVLECRVPSGTTSRTGGKQQRCRKRPDRDETTMCSAAYLTKGALKHCNTPFPGPCALNLPTPLLISMLVAHQV